MPEKTDKGPFHQPPEDSLAENPSPSDNLLAACATISSERYQAFVENIEEGVYEVDIQGNFLYFNNSLCTIFGYPREAIQFQNFSKFMDELYAKRAFSTFNEIYRTGQGISDLVWKIRDMKGNIRVIELSANLIRNQEGEKIGFRGIIRDISDKFETQEALRRSERRYRTLLDFVPYPIVVYTADGRVSYLNPAFTKVFGWTFDELQGKTIPNVPAGLEGETSERVRQLFEEKAVHRQETKRLTKDGRILDVVFRAAFYPEREGEVSGEVVILRDITREKRISRNNEALLGISIALPEYPDLDELLGYVSEEVKRLLGAEGCLVILLDEERNELYFKAAAHDDYATERRIKKKEIRYPSSKGVSGKVIRTGKPMIVPDTSQDPDFYAVVDTMAGFHTHSMLDVPLKSKDRTIGVLCVMNKKEGPFDETDIELLNMISGTVALSIENARFSEELKEAYKEVSSMNRAKDKVLNHLSHELKTPLAVLKASLNILGKRLSSLPKETYRPTIERAHRNLDRMLEIQDEVEDIMEARHYESHSLLSWLLEECADELEALIAEEVGEGPVVGRVRKRINDIFGTKKRPLQEIFLDRFVRKTLEEISPGFSHRQVEIRTQFLPSPAIRMPADPLKKVVVGLIKNAVENTPDEGRIEIIVREKANGAELVVRDYGVGITLENQGRIFEGFFPTQETMDYSTKRPFDFNAGGKGADLLRMKIFSERYNFKISMSSVRCPCIEGNLGVCPGRISLCDYCNKKGDCHLAGGTTFTLLFPAASQAVEAASERSKDQGVP